MSPKGLVLVSGATGYLGAEVTRAFINAGYRVRGTARSPEKAKAFEDWPWLADIKGKVEWVIVEDQTAPGAYDEAVKDVTIFAHTSSPFHYETPSKEKDMLDPALIGTQNALRAAQKAGVKRVVLTSSFAANLDLTKGNWPEKTFTDDDWNPATWEEAAAPDAHPAFTYCASKSIAEKWAWDYVKETPNVSFALTALCPPLILGPPSQPVKSLDSLNESAADVWRIIDGKDEPIANTGFPVETDVRDVARLHVLAAEKEEAKNQRLLIIAHHFFFEQIAEIVGKTFPDKQQQVRKSDRKRSFDDHYKTDSSKAEKLFDFKWRPFEETAKDAAARIFELEAKLGRPKQK